MNVNILQTVQGDTEGIPIHCLNPLNDQPIDVSGFTDFKFTIRDSKRRILIQKTYIGGEITFVTDGTDGELLININARDTKNIKAGSYSYDLETTDAVGDITTPVLSYFVVSEEVTK